MENKEIILKVVPPQIQFFYSADYIENAQNTLTNLSSYWLICRVFLFFKHMFNFR